MKRPRLILSKKKNNFFESDFRNAIKHRCVALLYALFNIDPDDEMSDTTGDAICIVADKQKKLMRQFISNQSIKPRTRNSA